MKLIAGPLNTLCFAAALSFTGCGKKADAPAFTIAVIPKATTHEYWKCIHAGAIQAQQELVAKGLQVDLIWKGPFREDDRDQQIQVVEDFTSRKVNGIVLAPLDSQALVNPVTSAVHSGIPVVVMDSGLKSDNYISFVATDNFKGGQLAGEYMGQLLNGRGSVILLRYAVGSNSTEEREKGFLDSIAKFSGIKMISDDQYAGATTETAYQAAQNLLNRFGHDVNGVVCVTGPSTVAMAKALRDVGLGGGKVKMIGFDSEAQLVFDLKNGDLQGLVLQDPVLMGYTSVMTMVQHLQGASVKKRIDTGVTMAKTENMSQPALQALLQPPFDKYLKD
jgi:ribose transport system substrate-binding protein